MGVPAQVKRRRYDTSGRRAASEQTRARILAAADQLLHERGYRNTTLAAIGRAAEVHVDTVYSLVGRKAEIVREVIELALSGTDRPIPATERPYVAAIRAEPDPASKLTIYAVATCDMLVRLAPLYIALRDAAGTDEPAEQIWREFSDRRARNMREFIAHLADTGGLRAGLAPEMAADTVWATNSPEIYVMLTRERGWTPRQYQMWLADTWVHLLLPASPGATR